MGIVSWMPKVKCTGLRTRTRHKDMAMASMRWDYGGGTRREKREGYEEGRFGF